MDVDGGVHAQPDVSVDDNMILEVRQELDSAEPEDLEEGVLLFVPGASDNRIMNVKKHPEKHRGHLRGH